MRFISTLVFSGLLALANSGPAKVPSKDFEIQYDGNLINHIDGFDDIHSTEPEEFDYAQFDDGLSVEEAVRKVNAKELTIKCATSLGEAGHCVTSNCTTFTGFALPTKCQGELSNYMVCCPDQARHEVKILPRVTDCGVRPVKKGDLIVGGTESTPHAWPWAAALYRISGNSKYFVCGGSIINERYILTAAHCVKRGGSTTAPSTMIVKLGAHHLSNSGDFYEIEQITPHEYYSSVFHNDDIALLKLKKKIVFTEQKSPVCLPESSNPSLRVEGRIATMIGWGTHDQGSMQPSPKLYEVQVPISNQSKCRNTYQELLGRNSLFNWDNVICAAYDEGGRDTCQGDSGGPMTVPDATNKYTQIGVVSFGYGCAQAGYPGVYTFVQHYVNWIRAHSRV